MNNNLHFQRHLFLLKLGLFKLAQLKTTCVAINQNNIEVYKKYSQDEMDTLLKKVDYLKVDDIKLDVNFIRNIEQLGSVYKGNNVNQINYFINLSDGYSQYIEAMKSKYKKELRREVRRFYESFETVDIIYFNKPAEADLFMTDMQCIHNNSWKKGTLNELAQKEVTELINQELWLGVIIYGDGKPISYMHGTLNTNHEYLLINNGYDETLKSLKPGKVLVSKIIEHHTDYNITSIDFGSGGSMYKKIFCNDSNDIYSALITKDYSKYSLLFKVQICSDKIYSFVKRTSEKLNLDSKLRKFVRNS